MASKGRAGGCGVRIENTRLFCLWLRKGFNSVQEEMMRSVNKNGNVRERSRSEYQASGKGYLVRDSGFGGGEPKG